MERLAEREMFAIDLSIRNKLEKVEVAVDNMSWVVANGLDKPDSLFAMVRQMVEHNLDIAGVSICFVPNYYPSKGYWFEPCAVRRSDGSVESMQLGSASHDYTKLEFFSVPATTGAPHWSEAYMDSDGAGTRVTSYGVPVRDASGATVAVVSADVSLNWLDGVMVCGGEYGSTKRFLVTGSYARLAGEDSPLFRKALKTMESDADRNGYVTVEDEYGETVHLFFNPVGGRTGWMLMSVLDDSEVFGTLRHVRQVIMFLAFAGLLLMGFIVWRASRSLERLRAVNAEKERMDGELRASAKIQQSMLPQRHIIRDDVEIFGSLVPAREVGGDLFDYFIRDDKLFFCIGDVSGKGVPSAMLMAVTHSLFRSASTHENCPARIMQAINEAACQGNDSAMFVTLFIGVLDLPTGHLRYCDAGHDCPITLGCNAVVADEARRGVSASWLSPLDCIPHLPVGVFDDVRYDVQEMFLPSGSTLFLYTDGLTEAKNKAREMFGLKRAERILVGCIEKQLKPKDILETVSEVVRTFAGEIEQSDDLTMLAIRYTRERFESIFSKTVVLRSDICDVARLSAFWSSVAGELNLGKSLAGQLRLAIEEAVVNVIDYAYPADTEGCIEISVMSDGKRLKIMITDTGIPFDPTVKEITDTKLSAEERPIGGLGILLVRGLMDSINYERMEGKNILTLLKNISTEYKDINN